MARILVTGSKGTLGRPLVAELRRRGHHVYQLDLFHQPDAGYFRADVASFRELEPVFQEDYDFVYHLAAEFGRLNGEAHYEALWRTNVIGTRHILEWQRRRGFRLILASSSEIYGEAGEEWLDEDLPLRRPVFPANDYALTKWVNELQAVHFQERYGLPIMRLRFFNAYGPGEHYHPYRSVVCLFVYRALHGLPWQVYRGYRRTFMYIDDFIPTLANAAERFRAGEVYNIGGRDYRSVEELAEIVLAVTGADPSLVEHLPEDHHNTVSKRPDIRKAVRDLGHDPRVTLEEGVPRTVEWMREVYRLPYGTAKG
ncbi:MAG: NAD(P)-dependent oxidoreductase [Clostridia bacterium]|nr:NAD(P)-dependent oxidoreductase [Clostridia bacterium]